jgi:hypothetical protein
MALELFVYVVSSVLGVAGGCSAGWFPASGKAALALGLVPAAGVGLAMAFCWGHPLEWLGPSLICAGPPLAFGFAVRARRRAADRWAAYLALALSGLELAAWLLLLVALAVG